MSRCGARGEGVKGCGMRGEGEESEVRIEE